ncbi:MAG: zf-HC2 domain-containing protein [Deferribacteres bacterium]|nr:zf-HC2 domain-containing protein [candidate division KSB1 bacterium]MCB9502711.1 zf-HC2 domain-containing protein [Deferribacteres bacterium]
MKCDNAKLLLMDYLYEELDDAPKRELEHHLKTCTDCAAESKSLQQTHKLFASLPEVEPEERIIFSDLPGKSWLKGFHFELPRLSFARIGYAAGLAFLILVAVVSLANMELKYDQQGFALRMSLFPQKTQQLTPEMQEALVAKLREENQAILASYLQDEHLRNEKKLETMMASYSQQLERQRQYDMQVIGRGLDAVRESQNSQYQKLMRDVNFQRK